jgi:endo-1,4-beta-xylanase
LFNFAVFENDLKWPNWSGQRPGSFSQQATMAALLWLREHHIPVKGHTLVWASWRQSPDWLKELKGDKSALQQAILRHIRDVSAATGRFTSHWDVLNEPMSHLDIIELLGNEAVVERFRTARESLPGQKLVLNDFDLVGNGGIANRRAKVISLVNDLKASGAAPDVLACQAHFWSNCLTAPEQIWKIIDELHSQTGLPIAATEFDINFPNDRLQADYTRDFLTAWFAHPATDSFIMWGFWGGAHWFGERGAMFRRDWTPKPNLEAYENLVFKEWWTKANGTTDKDGRFKVRGFQGDYVLQISLPGYQTTVRRPRLGKEWLSLEVVLHRVQVASSN